MEHNVQREEVEKIKPGTSLAMGGGGVEGECRNNFFQVCLQDCSPHHHSSMDFFLSSAPMCPTYANL